jgi:hypothetical protein
MQDVTGYSCPNKKRSAINTGRFQQLNWDGFGVIVSLITAAFLGQIKLPSGLFRQKLGAGAGDKLG